MFDEMIERIQNTTIAMLLKVRIEVNRPAVRPVEMTPQTAAPEQLTTNSPESAGARPMPSAAPKVGRNDPCPCGSGKKYKNCCGKDA